MKMKAIVLGKFGDVKNFRLENVDVPEPKAGEVRIKIKAISFNPVDYKARQGAYGGHLPLILGADCSGFVDAVGSADTGFSIGDEVYALSFCKGKAGSYAQYVCLPYEFVAQKPNNLTFEDAASLPLTALTAYRAVKSVPKNGSNRSFFISGASGGVGSIAVQLADYFHKAKVYSIAGSQESVEFITENLKMGRENIVIYKGTDIQDLKNKLLLANDSKNFSAVFDFVGQGIEILCLHLVDFSGHLISIIPESTKTYFSCWEANNVFFEKSLALKSVFVGTEAFFGKRERWKVYQKQLIHIKELVEKNILLVPKVHVLGLLSEKTVCLAHDLLESNSANGKLIAIVD